MALESLKRVGRKEELPAESSQGFIRIKYLGDICYLALDDDWARKALEGFVVYTVEEAEVLKGKSEWTKRMIHEAKKYGAKIIGEEGTWTKNHN